MRGENIGSGVAKSSMAAKAASAAAGERNGSIVIANGENQLALAAWQHRDKMVAAKSQQQHGEMAAICGKRRKAKHGMEMAASAGSVEAKAASAAWRGGGGAICEA